MCQKPKFTTQSNAQKTADKYNSLNKSKLKIVICQECTTRYGYTVYHLERE
jgi:hypothetical protein